VLFLALGQHKIFLSTFKWGEDARGNMNRMQGLKDAGVQVQRKQPNA
jgi:hypothetical protein